METEKIIHRIITMILIDQIIEVDMVGITEGGLLKVKVMIIMVGIRDLLSLGEETKESI